ncbi:MAG: bifunctional hydroxymethylpyrimidine kinase/phosphomethylpyrimidine kinase [Ruminococcaceae bacterium]|nr:bifunctional hydroxymethylpyrimidine kinase/phosphomethylpyrimidine kinase [Oscillospiraceae bacterium]
MKKVLTIAGSDSGGGAGIQADLKTMTALGVFGMSAVTALTAQNTLGVAALSAVDPDFLKAQLDAVFTDLMPDAVKIGMVASAENARVIAERLLFYKASNIVLDPVMVATSGASLSPDGTVEEIEKYLFPIADLITPNMPEAAVLSGQSVKVSADMCTAAEKIGTKYRCAVLLKGGHGTEDANDVLFSEGNHTWFCGARIHTSNTHGTGCTLSSAIASFLAKGFLLPDAVQEAKSYLEGALRYGLNLGHGSGPLWHGYTLL